MPSKKQEELTKETIKIIEAGGRIVLKRKKDNWFLHQHTNIASGPDYAVWGKEEAALEMFNLHWAHTIKKLYGCKVVVLYPERHSSHKEDDRGICVGGHTCARQALK